MIITIFTIFITIIPVLELYHSAILNGGQFLI